jgi:hypothetical protein
MAAIVDGAPQPGWPLAGLARQLFTGMVSSHHYYRMYVFALEQEARTGQPYWHPEAQA